jgi:hypothetical protein
MCQLPCNTKKLLACQSLYVSKRGASAADIHSTHHLFFYHWRKTKRRCICPNPATSNGLSKTERFLATTKKLERWRERKATQSGEAQIERKCTPDWNVFVCTFCVLLLNGKSLLSDFELNGCSMNRDQTLDHLNSAQILVETFEPSEKRRPRMKYQRGLNESKDRGARI